MQQSSDAGYGGLVHFAFDLLELDGENVARLPLLRRKERLAQLLQDPPAGIVYSEHEGGDGEAFRRAACQHGLEGVVSKRTDRPYLPGDRGAWVKSKCLNRAEFVVVGWSDPEGSRHLIGSLLLGYYDHEGQLSYAGRVGTGMFVRTLAMLHQRLEPVGDREDAAILTLHRAGAGSEARWPCPRCIGCDRNSSPTSPISAGPTSHCSATLSSSDCERISRRARCAGRRRRDRNPLLGCLPYRVHEEGGKRDANYRGFRQTGVGA